MKIIDTNAFSQSYDEIVDWYANNRCLDLTMEKYYLNFIPKDLPFQHKILDIGCGTGEPIAKYLIHEGYIVTGVDNSRNMIAICKKKFPKERWLVADMRTLDLNEKFHTVIAWHSLFHLSPNDQRRSLALLASYVENNGLFIFTSGSEEGECYSNNGGKNLYHASLSIDEYQQILREYNFKILEHKTNDPA